MNLTLPQMDKPSQGMFDILVDSPDWAEFCYKLSDDTGDKLAPLWLKNIKANSPLVKRKGSAYDRYRGQGRNKACVIIGASPALKQNYIHLKHIQHDPGFILIATSSALKFLLQKEIRPRFVFLVDGAADVAPKIDVGQAAEGMTLIATTMVHPNVFKAWKGNVRFIRISVGDKYEKEHIRLTNIKDAFPGGGTQFNAAVFFAYMTLRSTILIFVGNELSWDEQYYVDRPDHKDTAFDKFPWVNIHGGTSFSNLSFLQSKLWLEHALGGWRGVFINATEAGILGSSKRYGTLDYILQMKLNQAIAYTKQALQQFKEVN